MLAEHPVHHYGQEQTHPYGNVSNETANIVRCIGPEQGAGDTADTIPNEEHRIHCRPLRIALHAARRQKQQDRPRSGEAGSLQKLAKPERIPDSGKDSRAMPQQWTPIATTHPISSSRQLATVGIIHSAIATAVRWRGIM